MRRLLQPAIENENMRRKTDSSENEMTDFNLMQTIFEASMDDNWTPGQRRMTIEDHHAVAQRLLMNSTMKQIAISK